MRKYHVRNAARKLLCLALSMVMATGSLAGMSFAGETKGAEETASLPVLSCETTTLEIPDNDKSVDVFLYLTVDGESIKNRIRREDVILGGVFRDMFVSAIRHDRKTILLDLTGMPDFTSKGEGTPLQGTVEIPGSAFDCDGSVKASVDIIEKTDVEEESRPSFRPYLDAIRDDGNALEMRIVIFPLLGSFAKDFSEDNISFGRDLKDAQIRAFRETDDDCYEFIVSVPKEGVKEDENGYSCFGSIILSGGSMVTTDGETYDQMVYAVRDYSTETVGRDLNGKDIETIQGIVGGFGNTTTGTIFSVLSGGISAASGAYTVLGWCGVFPTDASRHADIMNKLAEIQGTVNSINDKCDYMSNTLDEHTKMITAMGVKIDEQYLGEYDAEFEAMVELMDTLEKELEKPWIKAQIEDAIERVAEKYQVPRTGPSRDFDEDLIVPDEEYYDGSYDLSEDRYAAEVMDFDMLIATGGLFEEGGADAGVPDAINLEDDTAQPEQEETKAEEGQQEEEETKAEEGQQEEETEAEQARQEEETKAAESTAEEEETQAEQARQEEETKAAETTAEEEETKEAQALQEEETKAAETTAEEEETQAVEASAVEEETKEAETSAEEETQAVKEETEEAKAAAAEEETQPAETEAKSAETEEKAVKPEEESEKTNPAESEDTVVEDEMETEASSEEKTEEETEIETEAVPEGRILEAEEMEMFLIDLDKEIGKIDLSGNVTIGDMLKELKSEYSTLSKFVNKMDSSNPINAFCNIHSGVDNFKTTSLNEEMLYEEYLKCQLIRALTYLQALDSPTLYDTARENLNKAKWPDVTIGTKDKNGNPYCYLMEGYVRLATGWADINQYWDPLKKEKLSKDSYKIAVKSKSGLKVSLSEFYKRMHGRTLEKELQLAGIANLNACRKTTFSNTDLYWTSYYGGITFEYERWGNKYGYETFPLQTNSKVEWTPILRYLEDFTASHGMGKDDYIILARDYIRWTKGLGDYPAQMLEYKASKKITRYYYPMSTLMLVK